MPLFSCCCCCCCTDNHPCQCCYCCCFCSPVAAMTAAQHGTVTPSARSAAARHLQSPAAPGRPASASFPAKSYPPSTAARQAVDVRMAPNQLRTVSGAFWKSRTSRSYYRSSADLILASIRKRIKMKRTAIAVVRMHVSAAAALGSGASVLGIARQTCSASR